MAAQQNDYRTHQLLCFVLNDASEICHYSDPISRYLYNESTRWPKPTAHSRLSQSRRSTVDLLQVYRKVPFLHTVFSLSLFLRHAQAVLTSGHTPTMGLGQWHSKGSGISPSQGHNSVPKSHPFKLLLYNLEPNPSMSRNHFSIT